MIERKELLAYLLENKERFKVQYHLISLGIFGSIARNEHRAGSDIDLLVEFEDNTQNLIEIKENLKAEIQFSFDSHVGICREKYIKPIFKKQILREACYI